MKPEAGHQRGEDQPPEGGQVTDGRHSQAQAQDGNGRQSVLPDIADDENRQQGQKTGYFADRLKDADPIALEPHDFDGKVVEKGGPGLEPDSRGHGQNRQVQKHRIALDAVGFDHFSFSGGSVRGRFRAVFKLVNHKNDSIYN